MSLLVDGDLKEDWFDSEQTDGEFIRKDSQFRNWVTADGKPGPTGHGGYKAEAGRYHLYVSHACPWAHRTLIFRTLKKLEDVISFSVVHPYMGSKGWSFESCPDLHNDEADGDPIYDHDFLFKNYAMADPDYSGIVTVPVLWDKKQNTIVNNESSEIIRMLNSGFGDLANELDMYPNHLREDIDEINAFIYDNINNGVYKTGFATTQASYESAFSKLFDALDTVEQRLNQQRYLVGNELTEADWRLFTTLLRFDPVYVGHFKCNRRRIADYPNLSNYLRELYQHPGISNTVNMEHIKQHYYTSHPMINPTGIVPLGPDTDLNAPHDRQRFSI